ncbi:MAG: hypothetical protein WBO46_14375, partial [Caldilineaceae bacterium]
MNVDLRRGPTSGKLERVAVWLRRYDVLPHAALVVVMFIVLLPILWLISSSLKDAQQFYNHPAELLPRAISLVNYQYMFTAIQALPVYMTNSFILAFGVTAIQVLCASLAGYAFARMTFRGRDVIFLIIVISMFVPR